MPVTPKSLPTPIAVSIAGLPVISISQVLPQLSLKTFVDKGVLKQTCQVDLVAYSPDNAAILLNPLTGKPIALSATFADMSLMKSVYPKVATDFDAVDLDVDTWVSVVGVNEATILAALKAVAGLGKSLDAAEESAAAAAAALQQAQTTRDANHAAAQKAVDNLNTYIADWTINLATATTANDQNGIAEANAHLSAFNTQMPAATSSVSAVSAAGEAEVAQAQTASGNAAAVVTTTRNAINAANAQIWDAYVPAWRAAAVALGLTVGDTTSLPVVLHDSDGTPMSRPELV